MWTHRIEYGECPRLHQPSALFYLRGEPPSRGAKAAFTVLEICICVPVVLRPVADNCTKDSVQDLSENTNTVDCTYLNDRKRMDLTCGERARVVNKIQIIISRTISVPKQNNKQKR